MVRRDPYTPEQKQFECRECTYRVVQESHQPRCPNCGGDMQNIAVPRE